MKLQYSVSKIIFGFVLPSIGVDVCLKDRPGVSSLDLRQIRLDIPFFPYF